MFVHADDAGGIAHLAAGSRVGPYEIVRLIGYGGMGEVYEARDTRLDRTVALKILSHQFALYPGALARFEREAKAVATLSHPNILAIHDFGVVDGTAYAASELLHGKTMRARLAEGPVPVRKAVDYCVQVAHGLAAAHDRGIVHCDLKPDNLFLTRDGRVKILDFGLAQSRALVEANRDAVTEACAGHASVLGTAGYMAPEQVRGDAIDGRADIFALGAVLFELLTGRRAFRARTAAETFSLVLNEDHPPLATSGRVFSPGLELVVNKCLEKDARERFQSAHDLALALMASLGTGNLTSRFVISAGGLRWRGLMPVMAAAACGAVATLALVASLGAFRREVVHRPPEFRYVSFSGRDRSPAVSRDGRSLAFTSDRDGISRIWIKRTHGQGEMPLTRGPDDFPRFSPDGGEVLFSRLEGASRSLYREDVFGSSDFRVLENALFGDWSPDGQHIAFVRAGRRAGARVSILGVTRPDGSDTRELATFPYALQHPRWSPDGATIAAVTVSPAGTPLTSGPPLPVSSPQQVVFVEVDGSRQWTIAAPLVRRGISAVAWTPGGREVIYLQARSVVAAPGSPAVIVRQDATTGAIVDQHWSPERATYVDVAGDDRIVFDTRSPRQNLFESWLEAGAPPAGGWISGGNSVDRQPVYSRDGRRIVFASNRTGSMDLWSIVEGRATQLTASAGIEWDPALVDHDSKILYSSDQTGHFEIWIANADGSTARQVTNDGANAENPTATPDGEWIAYASGHPEKRGLWKIRVDGTRATRLVAGDVQMPSVSPDGQYVLYREFPVEATVRIRVVRMADGSATSCDVLVPVVRPTDVGLGRARWMPDGKAIAFLGQDSSGVVGVFTQDFDPTRDTSHTRRPLGGFGAEYVTESFDISPDGRRLVVAGWQQVFSLMEAQPLEGLAPPAR